MVTFASKIVVLVSFSTACDSFKDTRLKFYVQSVVLGSVIQDTDFNLP